MAEIAGNGLIPEAAFARVRLRGDGLDISKTFGNREQGPVCCGIGHGRRVDACLGGGRMVAPYRRNMATRAFLRVPLRQSRRRQVSRNSALRMRPFLAISARVISSSEKSRPL